MAKRLKSVATASAVADSLGVHRSTVSRQLKKMGARERLRSGKRAQALTAGDRARVKSRLRKTR